MSAEPTSAPDTAAPVTGDSTERSTLDLCGLGWNDVHMVLDGLQLAAIEHHRQAVLAEDHDTRTRAIARETAADELADLLEATTRAHTA